MKKVLVMMTLFALGGSVVFAELPTAGPVMADAVLPSTTGDVSDFADVEGTPLSADETAMVKGGDLILHVDRDTQTMKVTNGSPMAIVNDRAETYTVSVTTRVVTEAQAAAGQNKDAMERNTTVGKIPNSYYSTQLPPGTYKLDYTNDNVGGGYGPGIHINASVPTRMWDNSIKNMNDYYIHGIDKDNTWGCIGVKGGNMSRVMDSYNNSSGPKTLTITAYSPGKRYGKERD